MRGRMEKWFVSAKKADFNGWAREFGISPVLARIIRNRDVTEEEDVRKFLEGTLEDCHSPWLLHGMEEAVNLILERVAAGDAIRVIGDYDVDGICSSYLLTRGLSLLGARADTAIPHRIHDGYGLNVHLIEEAAKDGIRLILTCDNGIAAYEQIELAGKLGMQVVVTDHHEVPFVMEQGVRKEILPPAAAIIDPKQQECAYPQPNICGAVVAYKLVQALYERVRQNEDFREEAAGRKSFSGNAAEGKDFREDASSRKSFSEKEDERKDFLEEALEFAALATVCDVMELQGENRILVREGLRRLAKSRNPGLKALIEVSGIDPVRISAYHLGFVIGPCLNATGRLDTAHRALELLQSHSRAEALRAAEELKELNDSRKNMTNQGAEQALAYVKEHHLDQDSVMVVYLPELHESLAGIIAGRVRESCHHPVFVLTLSEEGVKGSGRSIEAYHMYEHLTLIKQCFAKFGGHKMAAGLTLAKLFDTPEEDVENFRELLNRTAGLAAEDFIPRIHIDMAMPLDYPDMALAKELEKLEPFGAGNPRPLFAHKNLHFVRGSLMGAKQNFARYRVRTEQGRERELVFFGELEKFHEFLEEKFGPSSVRNLYAGSGDYCISITYQLGINVYQGRENLQFILQNYC